MIRFESMPTAAAGLRRVYGCFPSGVTAVCALVGGVPVGMAASSFTTVSITPPLVAVCVQDSSTTWPILRDRPRLGVSILAQHQDEACAQLSTKGGDRFARLDWDAGPDGGVFVRGATAWLDCSVHRQMRAGDHAIAVLKIHGLNAEQDTEPLVFHGSRFRRLSAT
jgi:flavin reductase (DIM6/NTAB) family NADH-FMN oxidoreductase RutF